MLRFCKLDNTILTISRYHILPGVLYNNRHVPSKMRLYFSDANYTQDTPARKTITPQWLLPALASASLRARLGRGDVFLLLSVLSSGQSFLCLFLLFLSYPFSWENLKSFMRRKMLRRQEGKRPCHCGNSDKSEDGVFSFILKVLLAFFGIVLFWM